METLFFLIIIGILSAVFGKGKTSRGQSRNKSFIPNNLKEIRTLFNQQLDQYSTKKSSQDIVVQKEFENIEKESLRTKKESMISPVELNNLKYTEPLQVNKVTTPVNDNVQVDEIGFSENVDAKTLINGIVWAEILGEPRSKKPYFVRKH
jgi:hypothetical protein